MIRYALRFLEGSSGSKDVVTQQYLQTSPKVESKEEPNGEEVSNKVEEEEALFYEVVK
jgi:hypothetical protein